MTNNSHASQLITALFLFFIITIILAYAVEACNNPKADTINWSWRQSHPIAVNIDPAYGNSGDAQFDAIKNAFLAWQNVYGRYWNVTFPTFTNSSTPITGTADTVQVTKWAGQNAWPCAETLNCLGQAGGNSVTVGTNSYRRLYAYIDLNRDITNTRSIFETTLHEIGHTFGLVTAAIR